MQTRKSRITEWYKEGLYTTYYTAREKDPAKQSLGGFQQLRMNLILPFIISYLGTLRGILTKPLLLFHHRHSIIPEQKDAFWTMNQISAWLDKTPALSWIPWLFRQAKIGLDTITKALPFLLKITPYLPFVGLGMSVLHSMYQLYHEKNKSLFTLSKCLSDVSSAVLLGVGLGLVKWGTAALAIYTGPLLIAIAAGIVTTVGLIRSCHHLYKAWKDPENRKQHFFNAGNEFLFTFINAASMVLTIFGIQSARQLQDFNIHHIRHLHPQALVNAGEWYKKTVLLSNLTLGAVGLLGVGMVGKKILSRVCSKKQKHLPKQTDDDARLLLADIGDHIITLRLKIESNPSNTNFIRKKLDARRKAKKELLAESCKNLRQLLDWNEKLQPNEDSDSDSDLDSERKTLCEIEREHIHRGVYQSFWNTGTTEALMKRAFKLEQTRSSNSNSL